VSFWQFFARDIGIDLGTANTLVYVKGRGILIDEPSVVAVDRDQKSPLAVGLEAKQMLGRTPGNIVAIRPMKDGVIADFDTTQTMLKYFIHKAASRRAPFRPRIIISIPSGVTGVERRAVQDAALQAGAREAHVIEEPMAAAIGAGLPVEEPTGSMVVDIGGGTTEVAIISLGGLVTAKSIRVAGDELDEAIVQYVKRTYNMLIGERTGEEIKMTIGSAYPTGEEDSMEVRGRDLVTGLPRTLRVTSEEIRKAINEPVSAILDAIKITLENTPPELAADIMDRGIVMTGGGALLKGLDLLISKETGMPVNVADEPLLCVVKGCGKCLDNLDILKRVARNS